MVMPINNSRLCGKTVRQIQALMSEGSRKSGDRLLSEGDLAKRFEVGRPLLDEPLLRNY